MSTAGTKISHNLPASVAELAYELADATQKFGARVP